MRECRKHASKMNKWSYRKRVILTRSSLLLLVVFLVLVIPIRNEPVKRNTSTTQGLLADFHKEPAVIHPTVDRIEGNCVVTKDKTGLEGKLPPAEPAEIVYRGNPDLMRVAITIDDGWNADMRILELLKAWEIEWTAFLIGGRNVAETHPEFLRQIENAGGEICNHTYSHSVMEARDQAFVVNEMRRAQEVITGITGKIYPYVRFCGGNCDATALTWAAQEGYYVIYWTIDSDDTRSGITFEQQVNTILSSVRPGAILLFHFGGYNTLEVLATVIPEIQRRGYDVTSLSKVMEGTPYRLKGSEDLKADEEPETSETISFLPEFLQPVEDNETKIFTSANGRQMSIYPPDSSW